MVSEIRSKLSNYLGKEVVIKYNLGRNKYEKYHVIIKEIYDSIFLVELESNEKKSFSYSDIITNTIKIDYKYWFFPNSGIYLNCSITEGRGFMQITSVTVRKEQKDGSRMRGKASVLLDDCFAVHDIRIIEGNEGLFIAMPSRQKANGEYRDIAHPINQETRKMFEEKILEAYKNAE